VVDEGSKSVLPHKIRYDISCSFGGIRGPNGRNVVMLDHSCTFDIHHKICLKRVRGFGISQCESPPDINIGRPFGQVDT
jgi:hypothetical protein